MKKLKIFLDHDMQIRLGKKNFDSGIIDDDEDLAEEKLSDALYDELLQKKFLNIIKFEYLHIQFQYEKLIQMNLNKMK